MVAKHLVIERESGQAVTNARRLVLAGGKGVRDILSSSVSTLRLSSAGGAGHLVFRSPTCALEPQAIWC